MTSNSAAEAPDKPEEKAGDGADSGKGSGSEPGLPRMLTDRYRLERLIAKGGMGRVYLATQLPLERRVALKHLVRPTLNEDFRRRFFLEASVLARLSHPNIVVVHDYGEAPDGSLFMAMEYLDGLTLLHALRREGRLTAARACEISGQVARALRSAHKQGVAHRDLKPGNIMLLDDADHADGDTQRDVVKVLDFGLVKVFQEDEEQDLERDLTRAEMMLGSPRYMAPEQIQCIAVDHRADIYSMGVVLFAMLVGRPPFVGSTLEILNQHLEAEVPSINALTQELKGFNAVNPDVEPHLVSVIRKCMQKNPEDRYQSTDELLLDLRTAYRLLTDDSLDTPSLLEITHPSLSSLGATTPTGLKDEVDSSHQRKRTDVIGDAMAANDSDADGAATQLPSEPIFPAVEQQKKPTGLYAVIAVVLLLLLVGLAWIFWLRDEPDATPVANPTVPTAPEDPQPAEPHVTRVSFTSSPVGAEVLRAGVVLGTTPLEKQLTPPEGGGQTKFLFRLEGHQPSKVSALIAGESSSVHANLIALAAETPPTVAPEEPTGERPRVWRPRGGSRTGQSTKTRPPPPPEPPPEKVPPSDLATAPPEPPPPEKVPATPPERPAKVDEGRDRLRVDDPRGAVPVMD